MNQSCQFQKVQKQMGKPKNTQNKKQNKQNTSACHPLAGHTRQKVGCASFWFGTYLMFMLHHGLILMQNKMNIQVI